MKESLLTILTCASIIAVGCHSLSNNESDVRTVAQASLDAESAQEWPTCYTLMSTEVKKRITADDFTSERSQRYKTAQAFAEYAGIDLTEHRKVIDSIKITSKTMATVFVSMSPPFQRATVSQKEVISCTKENGEWRILLY